MPARKRDTSRGPFAKRVPRAEKRHAGRTATSQTPLAIRTGGTSLSRADRERIRERVGRKLGKFALHIERMTVRIDDVNGPKGGVDRRCRIKVTLSGRPSIVVEARGETVGESFDRAIASGQRTVRRALDQAGLRAPKPARGERTAPKSAAMRSGESSSKAPMPEDGSLIGRRVGRSAERLAQVADRPEKRRRDVPVDTARPGVSASDRKVGGGSTAKRNTKLNTAGMVAALEDSAKDRPSRKSTRKSSDRARRDTPQHLTEVTTVHSGKARARAARAHGRGGGHRPRGTP